MFNGVPVALACFWSFLSSLTCFFVYLLCLTWTFESFSILIFEPVSLLLTILWTVAYLYPALVSAFILASPFPYLPLITSLATFLYFSRLIVAVFVTLLLFVLYLLNASFKMSMESQPFFKVLRKEPSFLIILLTFISCSFAALINAFLNVLLVTPDLVNSFQALEFTVFLLESIFNPFKFFTVNFRACFITLVMSFITGINATCTSSITGINELNTFLKFSYAGLANSAPIRESAALTLLIAPVKVLSASFAWSPNA